MIYKYCPKCGSIYNGKEINHFSKTKNKLTCKNCSFIFYNNPKPTVSAIISDKNGKILFTKRAIKPYLGWWDLPGGFINYGESAEKALRREIKEELGVEIEIKRFLGTFHEFYKNHGRKNEKYSIIALVYLGQLRNDKIKVGDDVVMYNFFPFNKLPKKIAFPNQRKFIENFKSRFKNKR